LFNPSNFGLVVGFLALGPSRAAPLDLWWANPGPALAVTMTVIVLGGITLTRRMRMTGVVAGFWLTLVASSGLLALTGHCMTARWHVGPICGSAYWILLVTSPEILVFLFFMITDPRTAPHGRVSRVVYGSGVAALAVTFASFQRTEYATKVAILAALLVACAFRPRLERTLPASAAARDHLREWLRTAPRAGRTLATVGVAVAATIVAGGATTGPPSTGRASTAAVAPGCGAGSGVAHRPDLPTGPLPPVANRPSIGVATHYTDAQAAKVAHDTVEDLLILGRAAQRRDPALATTAAEPPFLVPEVRAICTARRTGRILRAVGYQFDSLSVRILTRTASQRLPEIDVHLVGQVDRVTEASGTVGARHRERFDEIVAVDRVGRDYLVVRRALPPPSS